MTLQEMAIASAHPKPMPALEADDEDDFDMVYLVVADSSLRRWGWFGWLPYESEILERHFVKVVALRHRSAGGLSLWRLFLSR